jgi:hypothetical protein
MLGNLWEWGQDCWNESYSGAPTDGSAWTSGDCSRRVRRGGSWSGNPRNVRSAIRSRDAGHGVLDEQSGQGYWLGVDADRDSIVKWVSNATVTDALKAMKAKHVMVVADSCYSGTLTRGIKLAKREGDYFKRMAGMRTRVALTSGGLEPVEAGSDGHSVFARAFLAALKQNTSVLGGMALFNALDRRVRLDTDQTPAYGDIRRAGHEGGDFLFVRPK